jgi:hypothetical protein
MQSPTSNQVRDKVSLLQSYPTARRKATGNYGAMVEIPSPRQNAETCHKPIFTQQCLGPSLNVRKKNRSVYGRDFIIIVTTEAALGVRVA